MTTEMTRYLDQKQNLRCNRVIQWMMEIKSEQAKLAGQLQFWS